MATLRIAIADDEPLVRLFLERVLHRQGHRMVIVAENGRQLVEQCRLVVPDLIITDLNMPVMDGLEAVAQINRRYQIPVLLMTADEYTSFADREATKFITTYLRKPVKSGTLISAISATMEQFRRQALHGEVEAV